jgi:hypothetical protein
LKHAQPTRAAQAWQWLIHEPFVHIVVLGAFIFVLHAVTGAKDSPTDMHITVTQDDVVRLRAQFTKQWGREPDAAALKETADNFVREEVQYREALARGLDKDDVIVRRRLVQKMEFLASQDVSNPTDAELQAYFDAHVADYAADL